MIYVTSNLDMEIGKVYNFCVDKNINVEKKKLWRVLVRQSMNMAVRKKLIVPKKCCTSQNYL